MNPTCPTSTDNWQRVETTARAALGEPICRFIDACRGGDQPESQLIAVLHHVQSQYGHLSAEHAQRQARRMVFEPITMKQPS